MGEQTSTKSYIEGSFNDLNRNAFDNKARARVGFAASPGNKYSGGVNHDTMRILRISAAKMQDHNVAPGQLPLRLGGAAFSAGIPEIEKHTGEDESGSTFIAACLMPNGVLRYLSVGDSILGYMRFNRDGQFLDSGLIRDTDTLNPYKTSLTPISMDRDGFEVVKSRKDDFSASEPSSTDPDTLTLYIVWSDGLIDSVEDPIVEHDYFTPDSATSDNSRALGTKAFNQAFMRGDYVGNDYMNFAAKYLFERTQTPNKDKQGLLDKYPAGSYQREIADDIERAFLEYRESIEHVIKTVGNNLQRYIAIWGWDPDVLSVATLAESTDMVRSTNERLKAAGEREKKFDNSTGGIMVFDPRDPSSEILVPVLGDGNGSFGCNVSQATVGGASSLDYCNVVSPNFETRYQDSLFIGGLNWMIHEGKYTLDVNNMTLSDHKRLIDILDKNDIVVDNLEVSGVVSVPEEHFDMFENMRLLRNIKFRYTAQLEPLTTYDADSVQEQQPTGDELDGVLQELAWVEGDTQISVSISRLSMRVIDKAELALARYTDGADSFDIDLDSETIFVERGSLAYNKIEELRAEFTGEGTMIVPQGVKGCELNG